MTKDVKMVLEPVSKVLPMEDKGLHPNDGQKQKPVTIFCPPRHVAMALLENFILMAGAQNDVANGKATPEQIKKLATNTNLFLIDLGDHLMLDCGLNENDIKTITDKIAVQFKEATEKKK